MLYYLKVNLPLYKTSPDGQLEEKIQYDTFDDVLSYLPSNISKRLSLEALKEREYSTLFQENGIFFGVEHYNTLDEASDALASGDTDAVPSIPTTSILLEIEESDFNLKVGSANIIYFESMKQLVLPNNRKIYRGALFFDQVGNKVEKYCAYGAMFSFMLHPVFGVLNIVFGGIQLALATVMLTLSSLGCWSKSGREVMYYSTRHMLHGAANLLRGAILAIPAFGWLLGVGLSTNCAESRLGDPNIYYHKESEKLMGYKLLRDASWKYRNSLYAENSVTSTEVARELNRQKIVDCDYAI